MCAGSKPKGQIRHSKIRTLGPSEMQFIIAGGGGGGNPIDAHAYLTKIYGNHFYHFSEKFGKMLVKIEKSELNIPDTILYLAET